MERFSAVLAICVGNSPHKGQWRGALMFSLICAWMNGWVNNREAGDLRHHRAHFDVKVMDFEYMRLWIGSTQFQRTSARPFPDSWWRHQMETFSALLVLCAGNWSVTGEFPSQRPVARSYGVFFNLRLNKRLSKHSYGWWFETQSCSLWRHYNGYWFFFIKCKDHSKHAQVKYGSKYIQFLSKMHINRSFANVSQELIIWNNDLVRTHR